MPLKRDNSKRVEHAKQCGTHEEASMMVIDGGPNHNHTLWQCPICKRNWMQIHEHE